tara:strand:+ start:2509 stop:2925 length:417 start_codon:yes stop_codon:yes gene_type:complete
MSLLDTLKTPSEDEVLTATQKARMALLENMTKDGIPECNRDRRVMLELLNGADTTALAMKRMEQDSKQSEQDNAAAIMAAKIMAKTGGNNPFAGGAGNGEKVINTLPEGALPEPELVDGELDVGVSDLNYEDFMKKYD